MEKALIISAVRTPIGSFNGSLRSIPATRLGSIAIAEAVKRAGIPPDEVNQVIIGNVLSAGLGQAPARQAALGAGLPKSVCAVTVNKVCGSSLKAVTLAVQAILTGESEIVVAGGMESMSNAPYLLDRAREGYRMGHGRLIDSMIHDGLWDVYNDFHMGMGAEICADKYQISREEMDAFALRSYQRAIESQNRGSFREEIIIVEVPQKKGHAIIVEEDEGPKKVDLERLPALAPAFKEGGRVTAGNACSISDGAAAMVLASADVTKRLGLKPLARVIGHAEAGLAPEWFTIAPVEAIRKLLKKTGVTIDKIDLFEINEAFAASSIAVEKELGLKTERVNIRGGAVTLGHPIGASGAIILTRLLYALKDFKKKRGIASLCIGGGEAIAVMVERV